MSVSADASGLEVRRLALAMLAAVLDRKQTFDAALAALPREALPERRDRAFLRMLCATVLRRLGGIDRVLDDLFERGLADKDRRIRHILRLGLAQLLFMEVPDHAAVDSSVRLVDESRSPHERRLGGLVNAVLRRAAREKTALRAALDADPAGNLPAWWRARLERHYGVERCRDIAGALLAEPPLDLTARDPADADALAAATGGVVLPTGSVRLARPVAPETLAGFAEGRFWIQDAAAALPARLLGGDGPVLDLCAAPGGKCLQLAAGGAVVTALDRSAARLRRLEDNLRRTGLAANIVTADALDWTPPALFARILLDAPCSATGTLRRHPDVAWLKSERDIAQLADLESRLLDHAAVMLAPGGRLVYCVCSLEPEEGEEQIDALLARHQDFRRDPIAAAELPGLEAARTPAGDLRTLPCHWPDAGGLDGFYIARLERCR